MIKCFNVVDDVVKVACEDFAPIFKLNLESYDVMKQYCGVIDQLSDEFRGIAYQVEIDEITSEISVGLICEDITITNINHNFYKLAEKAKSVKFSIVEEDDCALVLEFLFPSLWQIAK